MGGEAPIFIYFYALRIQEASDLAALRSPVTCSSKSRSQVSKWLSASNACEPRLSWISTIEDNFGGPRGRVHAWHKHLSLGVLMSAWPNTTDQVDAITRCHHNPRMDHFLHVTPIRTYAHLQIKIKKKIRQKKSPISAIHSGFLVPFHQCCTLGSPNHTAWRWPPIKPRGF